MRPLFMSVLPCKLTPTRSLFTSSMEIVCILYQMLIVEVRGYVGTVFGNLK